ncbi:unnamed protein product [Linum tenue]|uniref:TLDc domain-containing protein n=1 Tax=Linum tenue TaxID=586396 RepID=A0AAV0NEU4_9ROSI|nr:unnamed protein product [Linum tenue]
MLDVWSWISDLPSSDNSEESAALLVFQLATSTCDPTRTLHLQARRTPSSSSPANPDAFFITLSVSLRGATPSTLWASDAYLLNSSGPTTNTTFLLPLLLHLLHEILTRAPTTAAYSSSGRFQKLRPEPVSWILDTHSPESFSSFFNLVLLTRLFWACACDAPSEVGSFYLDSLLSPNIHSLLTASKPVLAKFLVAVGADAELCFVRTLGYMLAKWLISREVAAAGAGLRALVPPLLPAGFSYAVEAYGYWALKGYAPIPAMRLSGAPIKPFLLEPNDLSLLKYALAHQQLEAVIQLHYSVAFHDAYVQVSARVDNLRFHVAKLRFSGESEYSEERHFVSRVRAWVGPEIGATYVAGLSAGRSTHNGESETTELLHVGKGGPGNFGTLRTRVKDWRWDQDVEGNAVVFDAVLHDTATGQEYCSGGGGGDGPRRMRSSTGPNRPFTKARGLIFAGKEYGDEVTWRLGKEMEGSVLKWRIGGEVWVTYFPNQVDTSFCETRSVEWCDEVDLPLIPGK